MLCCSCYNISSMQIIHIICVLLPCLFSISKTQDIYQCIPGCTICNQSEPTICFQCDHGMYLTVDAQCVSCSNGCAVCKQPDECLACLLGYTMYQQMCLGCSPNCLSCSVTNNLSVYTTCSSCNLGFFPVNSSEDRGLMGQTTQICSACIPQCLTCKNTVSCDECAYQYGFNSSSEACYYCGENCATCDQDTGCLTCLSGFFPTVQNQGDLTTCVTCGANCTQCSHNGTCKSCPSGYYPSGFNCYQCIAPCGACVNQTFCVACLQGYYLETNIVNNTEESAIQANYTLQTVCNQCPLNCRYCSDGFTCTTCNTLYYLKDNRTCEVCSVGCVQCDQDGCISCSGSFYLIQGQCKTCKLPCLFCVQKQDVGTYCYQCQSNEYIAIDGECELCSEVNEGCVSCIGVDACSSCAPGYYLFGTECLPDNGGLATVYIVLICIAGVIGLIAIVFGAIACWRSRNGYGVMGEGTNAEGVRASYYQFP